MNRQYLIIVIAFILSLFAANSIIDKVFDEDRTNVQTIYYDRMQTISTMLFDAMFHEAETIFNTEINKPDILTLAAQASSSESQDVTQARHLLYQRLLPLFESLQAEGIQQIQFHTPDLRSFLRMHRPDVYGDDLSPYRETVVHCNNFLEPVFGLESGRYSEAYRNVFPLFIENRHIGSVEISYSISEAGKRFTRKFSRNLALFVHQHVFRETAFNDKKELCYCPSAISPDWYYDRDTYLGDTLLELNRQIQTSIQDYLGSPEPHVFSASQNDRSFLIVFYPVHDYSGQLAGYLTTYSENHRLQSIRQESLMTKIYVGLLLIILFALITLSTVKNQRLKISEEKFKLMAHHTQHWEYWRNPDGEYQLVTPACETITGYSPRLFTASPGLFLSIVTDEFREDVAAHLIDESDKDFLDDCRMEFTIRTRNKDLRWIEHQCHAARDENGHFIGRRGSNIDITEKKKLEMDLDDRTRFFEQVFMQSSISTLLLDRDGWAVAANPGFTALFGIPAEAIENHNYNIFKDVINRSQGVDVLLHHVYSKLRSETWEMEYDIRRGAESQNILTSRRQTVWISIVAFPVLDHNGNLINVVMQHEDISKRKESDLRLKESEILFRSVWENSANPMRICDRDGRMLNVNTAFCSIVDLPREKLIGHYLDVVYAPGMGGELLETYRRRVVENSIQDRFKRRLKFRTGEEFWFDIANSYLNSEEDNEQILSIFTNISELKTAELALRESEEKFRALSESSSLGQGYWSVSGELIMFNSVAVKNLNRPLEDMLGKSCTEIFGVESGATYLERIRECASRQKSMGFEDEVTENGESKWFYSTYDCIYGDRGEILGIQITSQDISDRKNMEDETHRIHGYYRNAIRNLKGIPYIINLEQDCYEFMSEEAVEVFGMPADELTPADFRGKIQNLHIIDYSGKVWESNTAYGNAFRNGKISEYQSEFTVMLEDGSEKIFSDISVPMDKDNRGAVIRSFGILQDITTRKVAESERSNLEEQLRQSQKMESIGHLAGGVAHDFNNILTAQIVFASLLAEKISDEEQKTLIDQIQLSNERAENLVRQLLAFSRKQAYSPRLLDLNATVSNLKKMLRRMVPEDIELRFSLDADVPKILADPSQVEQIVINLIVNAKDAIQSGGKLKKNIELLTRRYGNDQEIALSADRLPAGSYVQIQIRDNGCGMTPEIIESIFEPFFTTKESGKGTGLGLSTVFGIIKQNDAYIDVISDAGTGTDFTVYWPLNEEEQSPSDYENIEIELKKGYETLLFVEDDDLTLMAISGYLEDLGYDVITARNGQEAFEEYRSNPQRFDCVITDMTMPKMNGLELIQEIHHLDPDQKIIMCSGYNEKWNEFRVDSLKDIPFIPKPYHINVLNTKIRELFDEED